MAEKDYKITFDREACVSTMNCTAEAPEYWLEADDGKVDLAGSAYNEESLLYELVTKLNDEAFEENLMAADSCPVEVIIIYEQDSGKIVAPSHMT